MLNPYDAPKKKRDDSDPFGGLLSGAQTNHEAFPWSNDDDFDHTPTSYGDNDFNGYDDDDDNIMPARNREERKRSAKTRKPIAVNKKRSQSIWKWVIIVLLLGVIGLGVYKIVVPVEQMTPEEVVGIVANEMGITSFPADQASAFAANFAVEYLTYSDNRSSTVSKYGVSATNYLPERNSTIVKGPFIGKINYESREIASIEVSAQLSDVGWVYFSISVYYDRASDAFRILGDPSFIPAPAILNNPPALDAEQFGAKQDEATTSAITPAIETFIKAYGASDIAALETVTLPESDPNVYAGFSGKYVFSALNNLSVWKKDSMPEGNYWVTVDVDWKYNITVPAENSPIDEERMELKEQSLTSSYQIKVTSNNGKYYIMGIEPRTYTIKPDSTPQEGTPDITPSEQVGKQNEGEIVPIS